MQAPTTLTDTTLEQVLNDDRPALLLFADGGLRGDFKTAFDRGAQESDRIVFAKIDPNTNPQAVARFAVGGKPTMIGWYNGAEVLRRSRPWGSDVPLAVEMLQAAYNEQNPEVGQREEDTMENGVKPAAAGKPVVVTDETFEAEVLGHDEPVLVDFWAEWCGPCRMVTPILEKLAQEYAGRVRIAKVNVDENPGLSQTFRIQSIPTIMLIKERTIVFSQPGALPEPAFRQLLDQLIELEIPPQEVEEQRAQ